MHRILRFTMALAVALPCTNANAQATAKPLRIIVPFPAGGAVDSATRVLSQSLSQGLGQPVIVDNRPGADGAIAGALVAKSAPDGGTVFFATNTALNYVPVTRKAPPYDPIADFTPVSMIGRIGVYLWVANELPARTVSELVGHARANPGKLNYGTATASGMLATAQIMSIAGIKMVHVPYNGETQLMNDLMAGRIQVSIGGPFGIPLARDGRIRALASLLPKRHPQLPAVPTLAEAGLPEYSLVAWGGIFGPAGMSDEITARLSREFNVVLKRPDIVEVLGRQGFEAEGSTPAELATFLRVQVDAWARAVREAGIKPE